MNAQEHLLMHHNIVATRHLFTMIFDFFIFICVRRLGELASESRIYSFHRHRCWCFRHKNYFPLLYDIFPFFIIIKLICLWPFGWCAIPLTNKRQSNNKLLWNARADS